MSKKPNLKHKILQELNKLYPQFFSDQKISEGDNIVCDACGRLLKVQVEGKGQLFCCGLPMRVSE